MEMSHTVSPNLKTFQGSGRIKRSPKFKKKKKNCSWAEVRAMRSEGKWWESSGREIQRFSQGHKDWDREGLGLKREKDLLP